MLDLAARVEKLREEFERKAALDRNLVRKELRKTDEFLRERQIDQPELLTAQKEALVLYEKRLAAMIEEEAKVKFFHRCTIIFNKKL